MTDVGLGLSLSSRELNDVTAQEYAQLAKSSGFTSVWSLDNPVADQAEPLVFLTAVAVSEPSLKIGTGALIGPVRDPILLAKQAATVDWVTQGRLTIGLTIGRRPGDYEIIGRDFHKRGRSLEDVVNVLHGIWRREALDVHGQEQSWTSLKEVGLPPLTPGGPRLLLGGQAPRAVNRAIELADGFLASATGGPSSAVELYKMISSQLEAKGRQREDFSVVANAFVVTDKSRSAALSVAIEALTRRHGGPPAFDVSEVVFVGEPSSLIEPLSEFARTGWNAVNLVPVVPNPTQIENLAPIAEAVSGITNDGGG
jgi:alkanesulfonate monooxygenase SsuD/methylene tetrahydromethanopterin reductase-like flavin-dependent oxidoreductase (luciferase family)